MCADWNQLFYDPNKIARAPDPLVDEFCREARRGGRVLDLGCGGGRHLLKLARAGLRACGCDVSPQALKLSRAWLQSQSFAGELALAEMTHLPFANDSFDGAISINVLNHAVLANVSRALSEVHRLLASGSPFFFVIIGRDDFRCGEGDEIEPFTFIHRQGIEAGVPHHYCDRSEVVQLTSLFRRSAIIERRRPYDPSDPIFGNDPRATGRSDAYSQHWAVKAWK